LPHQRLTLIFRDGLVYDGSGSAPFEADVGVAGDRIVLVGRGRDLAAETVMDARGLCVSPGFVDTHGHSEFTLLAEPAAQGKVLQGVTTEINGNCGLSAAPLLGEALAQREGDLREYDIRERWSSLTEYFDILAARRPALNYGTLVGHGNIRASAMGYSSRKPSDSEMQKMKELLLAALGEGAFGLSTGLIYPPGLYSETGELIELSAAGGSAKPRDFIYATHMRSEGDGLLEALEEALAVGREARVKVHISHIKTAGRKNWFKASRAAGMLEEARAEGRAVTCDRYPYTAASTDLDSVLPGWVFEGGAGFELRRLAEPATRRKISEELAAEAHDWEKVWISSVSSEKNRWMEGKSLAQAALALKREPVDALIEILVEERLKVGAIFHSMSEENLARFLSLPFAMVGSDSSVRADSGPTHRGRPHPRGFGSFPRFLRWVLDSRAMPLEEAIRRITGLPALTFGLQERGFIRSGFHADITVFDPRQIRDRATYEEPFLGPSGISHVMVGGKVVASGGQMTGERPGMVLRPAGGEA